MAVTVSPEFKEVWARKAGKRAAVEVRYKRRYYTGGVFVHEATWQVLDSGEFETVGEIVNNLDTPFLNVFKTAALTLRLKNSLNQWVPSIFSPSIFAADEIAPDGYISNQTLVQIRFAYELPSTGDLEWVELFTGLLTDLNFSGADAGVEATVKSKGHLLETADSTNVSTVFLGQATVPANADGIETDFVSTQTGVARVDAVYVDGIIQNNKNYTISGLDTVGGAVTVQFDAAPISGPVTVDLRTWATSQLVEDLVGLLCDEAGVLLADRDIDPVTFESGVDGFRSIDTQDDFNDGTVLQAVDTNSLPGALRASWQVLDTFSDNEFLTDPVWTVREASGTITAASGNLLVQSNAGHPSFRSRVTTPSTHNLGTWRFKMINQMFIGGIPPLATHQGVGFMTDTNGRGYWLSFDPSVNFYRIYYDTGPSIIAIASVSPGTGSANVEWRITRDENGNFKIYNDQVTPGTLELKVSFTHLSVTTSTQFSVGSENSSDDTGQVVVDDIYFSKDLIGTTPFNANSVFESEVFDIGLVPIAWGTLDAVELLNGDTIVYEVGVADTAGGPFVFSALGAGNQITSALKQFFKIRATFTRVDNRADDDPVEIRLLTANFTTTTVLVSLAIFTGETVAQSIERLARLADYEFGFTGSGRFYFRQKAPAGSSVLALNQENAISELSDYHPGDDSVITVGQVQQGSVFHEYDGDDAGEVSPTSEEKFGRIIRFEDYSETLLRNDSDIGRSRSVAIYKNNHVPKRRARAFCKIVPWLELGDIITLSYYDHPLFATTLWGDPLQTWGAGFAGFDDPQNVLARDLEMKIIGLTFLPDRDDGPACELSLQEVLPS